MKNQLEIAAFAGGSFYVIESIFSKVFGVYDIISGYSGGHLTNPTYREVCSGKTGHAETVRIEYNPHEVSYETLLKIFMDAHNPTTLNKQGSSIGSQFRSVIFCSTEEQLAASKAYINTLEETNSYKDVIVTEICKLEQFYEAERYHQNYYEVHNDQPFSKLIINRKLQELQDKFGNLINHHQLVS